MVFAQWVVPTVLEFKPTDEDLEVGFWVGLDGFSGGGFGGGDSNQLLQAGVAATVTSGFFGGNVEWRAWIEWWHRDDENSKPKTIENFRVVPGDTACFMVCAPNRISVTFPWSI